jgi:carboxyl-terminal processing protease
VDDLERMNRDLEGSFYGIGVQFQIMNDSVCVVEVVSGGPAERVGVQAGDRIVAVDGKSIIGKNVTNEDVFANLRGENGTKVKITVKRASSKKTIDFTITRGEIPSVSVDAAYVIDKNIGYIRVSKFAANTYNEFLQNLNSLRNKGAERYILDLRGNTGGLLDQAILMANEFLQPMQSIVEVRGRKSADNANWLSDGNGAFTSEDLVVLTDEFSASCSEIVAGAIQDNDRGLIVGRRTFGKGLVQRLITFPDSSQMRLTVQRYYTPSGRCIQKDFTRGDNDKYESEILDRYTNGEIFSADSAKLDKAKIFKTIGGRTVYGGGGIMPDVFVPSDTSGVTSYYINVSNAGLLNKFAYEYADLNRDDLVKAKNTKQLVAMLPPSAVLLNAFVSYASQNGVAPRWYYINISSSLIVNQLRALIARDILGVTAYYEIANTMDPALDEAVKQIKKGVGKTMSSQARKK